MKIGDLVKLKDGTSGTVVSTKAFDKNGKMAVVIAIKNNSGAPDGYKVVPLSEIQTETTINKEECSCHHLPDGRVYTCQYCIDRMITSLSKPDHNPNQADGQTW